MTQLFYSYFHKETVNSDSLVVQENSQFLNSQILSENVISPMYCSLVVKKYWSGMRKGDLKQHYVTFATISGILF